MKTKVETLTNEPLTKSTNEFPVVGIGASAGGLDAFKKLIQAIPEDSGMAYVLVQHLDPNHESLLPELLQKVTKIPVLEITDDIKVEPDHIYIIPSNKILIADDGVLRLAPRVAKPNMPIDLFFTSLAEVHQSHSIGVVLSGNGSDGTRGLQSIKNQGGIAFAQTEASAGFIGMPQSAVQARVVDFILEPEKIPTKLLEVTRITNGNGNGNNASGFSSGLSDEDAFKQILALIRIRKGIDFTFYKQTTIQRRTLRRMALNRNEDPASYLDFLRKNKEEQDILYQDFLIPVTEFFRDKKSFDYLCDTIFPQIVNNIAPNDPIRIWIAGCSTGQEAYSMAICLREFLGDNNKKVQIFATDISEPAIDKARAGIYYKTELENISPQRLKEFFTKNKEGYQVNQAVREMCVFALHNFLKDPPFGKVDLVSCRNVLIYMEPYLQKKALTTFHYALNLKGFLLLGKSETISSVKDLFATAVKGDKLFSRKDVPGKFMHVTSQRSEQTLQSNHADEPLETQITDYQKAADDVIRKKYMPAGIVVNEAFDIVNYRGKTNEYLEQTEGKPSHNLLKLAKQDLAFELRSLLHKAKKENGAVSKENIRLNQNPAPGQKEVSSRMIRLEAIPLNTVENHYLVLFHESQPLKTKTKIDKAGKEKDAKDLRIQQLEEQLVQTLENMRSITEEQEAANEELQSGNEELLSSSEELQSLNEELETSKEELQSTNEELMVINQEIVGLNGQVKEERDYADAIISTIHNALLVLDKNFRVKSANKAFYQTFAVNKAETEGVILFDLGNEQWNIPSLRKFLQEILPKNTYFHGYEVTHKFPVIGEKIMELNASRIVQKNKGEELILLSIKDNTQKAVAGKKIEESEQHFRLLADLMPAKISNANPGGDIIYFNKQWLDYSGCTFEELKAFGYHKMMHPDEIPEFQKRLNLAATTGTTLEMEMRFLDTKGIYKWHLNHAAPIKDENGIIKMWVGVTTEIHDQKLKELEKDEFISIASHEMKTPLTTAKAYLQMLELSLDDTEKEAKLFAVKANESVDRLNELIGDLLDVSKIQLGKLNYTITAFNFNDLIESTVENLRITTPAYSIIKTGKVQDNVTGDKNRLQQVVINLLTNAMKYSPDSDTVFIEIAQDKEMVKVTVRDTGIGLNADSLARVFEKYHRVEEHALQFQGMGIGLFISYEIIQRHHGKMWVESELGKGSSFYFSFPVNGAENHS